MKVQLQNFYESNSNVVDQPIKQQNQHAEFVQHLYEDVVLEDDAIGATFLGQKQAH